jgi:hypothetical protein
VPLKTISEELMKSLRIVAVMLAASLMPLLALPAHAQQEVDPDHFDQPSAAKPAPHHSKTVARPQQQGDAAMASSRAGVKMNHHRQAGARASGQSSPTQKVASTSETGSLAGSNRLESPGEAEGLHGNMSRN